ncbi:MBL fold metallo-hydrolase [Streptomyces sp. NBC_00212]|uniref:MBL fold metallo-hydrolase n=1 Tax=Streptomyces sp. NBC_00212 TaxID=2975684 RepID=UPI0032505437
MLLQVLGTAAGGGVPQWNCACPGCAGARVHPRRRRRHASLAVRSGGPGTRWHIVNAGPDITDQIESVPALLPGPGSRESPVAGVILTDAELDHTLGIARLRETEGFVVRATAPVRDALLERLRLGDVLGPYTAIEWRELSEKPEALSTAGPVGWWRQGGRLQGPGATEGCERGPGALSAPGSTEGCERTGTLEALSAAGADGGRRQGERPGALSTPGPGERRDPDDRLNALSTPGSIEVSVSAIPVSAKRPRYAAGPGPDDPTWSVALRLYEPATGASAVYAPAVATWSDALDAAVRSADVVILDGTFWDDDEPVRSGISTRTATAMGHLPIVGPHGTSHRLAALPGRCLYTHLNNTNPLNDPAAAQHARLAERGLEVAAERMVIEL